MQDDNKDFYVYIYLDPRKQGEYIYGDYKFDYEPFYVGKGIGSRLYSHLSLKDKRNNKKKEQIIEICEAGFEPIILKIKDELEEEIAFFYEIELISLIGRLIDSSGPLTNISLGGKIRPLSGIHNSFYGHSRSEQHKNQMKIGYDKHVERIQTDIEYKKRIVSKRKETIIKKYGKFKNGFNGKKHSEEVKIKIGYINSLKQKGELNSQYGTCWIYSLELKQNKKIKKEELNIWINKNWIQGRKIKF